MGEFLSTIQNTYQILDAAEEDHVYVYITYWKVQKTGEVRSKLGKATQADEGYVLEGRTIKVLKDDGMLDKRN